jgi:hypothetical protein
MQVVRPHEVPPTVNFSCCRPSQSLRILLDPYSSLLWVPSRDSIEVKCRGLTPQTCG